MSGHPYASISAVLQVFVRPHAMRANDTPYRARNHRYPRTPCPV